MYQNVHTTVHSYIVTYSMYKTHYAHNYIIHCHMYACIISILLLHTYHMCMLHVVSPYMYCSKGPRCGTDNGGR